MDILSYYPFIENFITFFLPTLLWSLILLLIVVGLLNVIIRVIPKHWYANILSITNFLCGLFGLFLIVVGQPLVFAYLSIILGQFFDLLDGKAASKWGSTKNGDIFDDIADATSFGLTTSVLILYSIDNLIIGAITAIIYFSCTAYRLYRFLKNKRQANKAGGVEIFAGMPSPGASNTACSSMILLNTLCENFNNYCTAITYIKVFTALTIAGLMISKLEFKHFGRVLIKLIPTPIKLAACTALLILAVGGMIYNQYTPLVGLLFTGSTIYVIYSLFAKVINSHD